MGSKSKSSSATTYNNTDKRAIADNGALAITGDGTSLSSRVSNSLALTDSRSWQNNDSRSWQNNDSRSWQNNDSRSWQNNDSRSWQNNDSRSWQNNDSRSWQNNDSRSWQNNDSRSWVDNSVTTVNSLDAGAIKSSADVVKAALQTIQKADATNNEGFESTLRLASESFGRLVDLAGDVLGGGTSALERSQELTAQAYRESVETRQATIDNKTISTIAIAGTVAFIGYGMMKK